MPVQSYSPQSTPSHIESGDKQPTQDDGDCVFVALSRRFEGRRPSLRAISTILKTSSQRRSRASSCGEESAGVATTTSAGLSVLVTAYDPTVYVGDEAIDATLVVPATGAVSSYYCLHSGNSVYDKIWADLNATGGLARTDGHTYKLKHMANEKGMEMIKANVSSYVALQDESLKTSPFPGTVSRLNGTHATLTWKVRVPSVTTRARTCDW